MTWLWLLPAFGVFMALIWSVYALNQHAAGRFGYEPFSVPNAAFMLVANLLLLAALTPAEAGAEPSGTRSIVMLIAALLLSIWMLLVIARRTSILHATYAVALLAVGAIAVLPSLLFMGFATAAPAEDTGEPKQDEH